LLTVEKFDDCDVSGFYNSLAHNNYIILTGGEKISKVAEKIPYQDAGVVVINQSFSQDDLKTVVLNSQQIKFSR
jgi:hypothetical protein